MPSGREKRSFLMRIRGSSRRLYARRRGAPAGCAISNKVSSTRGNAPQMENKTHSISRGRKGVLINW